MELLQETQLHANSMLIMAQELRRALSIDVTTLPDTLDD
jgi:hypothetical protein